MNIITYNVRGLGRGIKWPTIRRMVNKQHIDMLCIQETKKEIVERSMCQALWGNTDVKWEAQAASNSAGGILCLWSEKRFKL